MTFDKEKYDLLKKNHLCTRCKKQDAFTLVGKPLCSDCYEKNQQYKKIWWEKNKSRNNAMAHKRYKRLKEQHKCPFCLSQLDPEDKCVLCPRCRGKHKRWKKINKNRSGHLSIDLRRSSLYCWRCAKQKPLYSRRLCEKCYFEQKKYFKPKGGKENPWRKDNHKFFQKSE